MNFMKQSHEILHVTENPLQLIERAGRVCYRSEDKITNASAAPFVASLLAKGHESVIEHASATVKFITDRAIANELVRHRLCSYSQESTRYVRSVSTDVYSIVTEKDVIDAYIYGMSMRKISEMSKGGFTEWQVYKILDSNDIPRRSLGNTGPVVGTYFHSIDTVEKAYLLGFIQADGSVSRKNNSLVITQHKDYAWYIERMVRDFIRPSTRRYADKDCQAVSVVSDELISRLIELGVVPNKSNAQTDDDVDRLWEAVPTHLIPAFLRGFLDGDGNIRFFKQKNKGETTSCNITWNGHKHLLTKISNWLTDNYGYTPRVYLADGCASMHRVSITSPAVGLLVVKTMLENFSFPYGHPAKTSRMLEVAGIEYGLTSWGDPKFKVIIPTWVTNLSIASWAWAESVDNAEDAYRNIFAEGGSSAENSRASLPLCLKTEIIMTANFRSWRNFFELRTAKAAHPQMRELVIPLLEEFKSRIPIIFDDIEVK